jgi:hypothetical protein
MIDPSAMACRSEALAKAELIKILTDPTLQKFG